MLRAIVGIYPMHTASDSSREPCCKSVFVDKHIYLCALYDVHVQCVHTGAMKPWEIINSHNASACENSVCFLPLPRLVVLWLQFLRKRELNFGIRFDLILTWEKKKKIEMSTPTLYVFELSPPARAVRMLANYIKLELDVQYVFSTSHIEYFVSLFVN